MLLCVLLGLAASRWDDEEESLLQGMYNNVDRLIELDSVEIRDQAANLKDAIESNRRVSQREIEKFMEYLEKRKQKKEIKKIIEKLLKKRGLDKITGKKFALVQKGCKLAKSRCLRAQKMARQAVRRR